MKGKDIILCLFIAFKLTANLWLVNPLYDLHRDEYLHLDQAQHLAWGYDSVPPFTSWVSWLILQLGNGVFWVRLFPALFGALTLIVVWKTIEVLKGNLFALILAAMATTFSVVLRINILLQPNSMDILSWTLFYYTIIQYINTQKNKWLYWAAVVFAIGFLNKYNIVFLMMGIVPAIGVSRYRSVFLNPALYFAALLALLIISPNLYWQYQHNFVVFHHLRQLTNTQLVHVNRLDFLKEQFIFFIGGLYILILAFLSFFTYPSFYKYRLFCWSFIFTLAVFTYFRAKGYYAIGLYPALLAFGAVYTEKLLSTGWKKHLRPVALIVTAILFIPMLKVAFPTQAPAYIQQHGDAFKKFDLLRWEDGKDHALPQDFADMLGWGELAKITDSAIKHLSDTTHIMVLCDNYGQAGAVNYYTTHKNIKAFCMQGDYFNWYTKDAKEIHDIIWVKTFDEPVNFAEARLYADTIIPAGKIENSFAREKGTAVYILKGIKSPALLRQKLLQQP